MIEATNSMLGVGKLCMRKAFFNHRMMLTHKAKGLPLRRGSGVHAILENFYQGEKDPRVLSIQAVEAYGENINRALPYMSERDIQTFYKDETMVSGLAHAYVEHYASDLERWTVEAVEKPCKARPINPKDPTVLTSSTYAGVLDMVVRENDSGRLLLVEHKSTGKIDSTYWHKLMNDPQLSGYWLLAHANGYPIDGIVYNVVQFPGIRQRKTETVAGYHQRLRDEMMDKPEKYFHRKTVTRTQEQLTEFLINTWGWLERLEELWDKPMHAWLKSDVVACTSFHRICEFIEPCSHGIEGPHMLAFDVRDMQNPEYWEVA